MIDGKICEGIAVSALLAIAGCAGNTDQREVSVEPPPEEAAVDTVEAEILDAATGAVQLRVTFAKGEQLPPSLVVDHEGQRVRIHDDGEDGDEAVDGVFTAQVTLDLESLAGAAVQHLEFDGRVARPARALARLDLSRLRPGVRIPLDRSSVSAAQVLPEASLLIRDLRVVEDPARTFDPCTCTGTPMGKWTFGYLMAQIANPSKTGISPSTLARAWVEQWLTAQTINTFNAPARDEMRRILLDPWEQASGGPDLDVSKAPFKLLAIVNRIDLADNLAFHPGSAGESRFVFGALDRRNGGCKPLQFVGIFEYGIEANGCSGLKGWAKKWFALGKHPIGSPAYNAALEAITERFAKANAAPHRQNGSALNQLRTNEVALASPWELREFRLASCGLLQETTVKRTPAAHFNETPTLSQFILDNSAEILAETYDVPLELPAGSPFLGTAAPAPTPAFLWRGNSSLPITPDQRFHFSLNTCSGCHTGETKTIFTHVKPAPFGTQAALSGFLTGIDVTVDGITRHFADLERRQQRMADLLGTSCLVLQKLPHLHAVH